MVTQEIQRQFGYTLPPTIVNDYVLRKLSKYAGRLFCKVWRNIMRATTGTACWFTDEQISRHARIPLERISEAQAECVAEGLLVIRPGGGANQQRYMFGERAIGLIDTPAVTKYRYMR